MSAQYLHLQLALQHRIRAQPEKNNSKARIHKDIVLQGSAKLQELVNSGVHTTAEYVQSNSTILHAVQLSLENPVGGNALPQKMTMERLAQELELHLAGTHERQVPTTVGYLYTFWRSPSAMLMPYGVGYGPQGIHGYQAVDPWLGLSHQANQCCYIQHADLQLLSACSIPCTDSRLDPHAYLMHVTCIPDCCVLQQVCLHAVAGCLHIKLLLQLAMSNVAFAQTSVCPPASATHLSCKSCVIHFLVHLSRPSCASLTALVVAVWSSVEQSRCNSWLLLSLAVCKHV